MKLLIDTCVVLDVLENREPFVSDAKRIFLMAAQNKATMYITACSVKDIYYLIHKYNHNSDESKRVVASLLKLFNVLDVNGEDLANALAVDMNDYEDSVITQSCLRNQIDYIVTRNIKDFVNSPVRAVLPADIK